MNLQELDRLAAEAPNATRDTSFLGTDDAIKFFEACTPERIAALVRVADAAARHFDLHPEATSLAMKFALRDLEATP